MRRLATAATLAAAIATAATGAGCFTTWTTSQLAGNAKIWDEQVREAAVPLPGIDERLVVSLPLAIEYEEVPATPAARAPGEAYAPPARPAPLPFALTCRSTQQAQDAVYHSAFRYGSRWKKTTAIMFLLEGALGAAFLLAGDGTANHLVSGGFLAIDAVGTGATFFIPRKEIFRREVRPVTTPVRGDCPDALVLEIAGEPYAIDAAGRIDEVGETALDEWMQAPAGVVRVILGADAVELSLGVAERCAWNRHHEHAADPGCVAARGIPPRTAAAVIAVAPGTLTGVDVASP